jgi:hypothetical protein
MDSTAVDQYEMSRTGWLFFAGLLLVLRGTVDVVNGLWFIDRGEAFSNTVVFDKLETWGWLHLVLGIAIAAIGFCVIVGQRWAITTGIVLGSLGIVFAAFMLPEYPFHAIVSMTLTGLALYGLVVYGPGFGASGVAPGDD